MVRVTSICVRAGAAAVPSLAPAVAEELFEPGDGTMGKTQTSIAFGVLYAFAFKG